MCKKCDDIITCAGSGHHLRPDRIGIIKEMPGSAASGTLCISVVKPTRCTNFSNLFYFGITLYMFRTVFPSIIRSSRLYVQHSGICLTYTCFCIYSLELLMMERPSETCRVLFQNKIIIIISVMELGHLLTHSGLTYPEVSSKVCHDSFCQSGNSVSLPWVIYCEEFYLHGVSTFSYSPVICPKLVLF